MTARRRGVVAAFDGAAGLGTIVADADGVRLPFHCVEIADGTRTIEPDTTVEFSELRKLGGVEAADVTSLLASGTPCPCGGARRRGRTARDGASP